MRFTRTILAASVLIGFALPASAGSLPTMRGVDHVGITVPDIKQATRFFVTVMGCKEAMSFGPFRDDKGTFMQDLLNVHPRAVIHRITELRCGNGSNIELFQYSAPDQKTVYPRNSDYAGHHIAFYVDDIAQAAAYMKKKGLRTFLGPFPVKNGPAAGQTILYVLTPWGLQLELISYPNGMAYEKTSKVKLWSPKDR